MNPDRTPGSDSNPDVTTEQVESTASEVSGTAETDASVAADQSGYDQSQSEYEFSPTDVLFYTSLLIGGAALAAFPEPATSFIGLVCVVTGVFLAAVDLF